ncbi:hypothetical protein [Sphingobium fuliginis]|uniref:Uncharacterized protein n=1 Tax=Sphingobium fuliginis ATCC 27551 TaxID=1208342 RepID=A0A5B8CES6_SPHSA|nr:hypothetical protein [Sphingobium fuliginis]QDC37092.1 hypothetical protein FIL70_07520 [Sphingobium fuliginis ATCC 27551]
MEFDYYREMAEAAASHGASNIRELEWVMTEDRIADLRRHLAEDVGVDDEVNEMFGIPIVPGSPKDGAPFELRQRS